MHWKVFTECEAEHGARKGFEGTSEGMRKTGGWEGMFGLIYSVRDPAGVINPEFIALGAPSNCRLGEAQRKLQLSGSSPGFLQGGKFRKRWND